MIVWRPVGADDTAALARGLWAYLAKKGGIKKEAMNSAYPVWDSNPQPSD